MLPALSRAIYRDHFIWHLSVHVFVCLFDSHNLVVPHLTIKAAAGDMFSLNTLASKLNKI